MEKIDGSMAITHKGVNVKFVEIMARPKKEQKPPDTYTVRKTYTPPADHPWRNFEFGRQSKKYEHK
jgi:hypothetical protein